jgi:hypothetical protein
MRITENWKGENRKELQTLEEPEALSLKLFLDILVQKE